MQLEGFTDVSTLLRAGVYALCKRGVVIYVGKSKSLYAPDWSSKCPPSPPSLQADKNKLFDSLDASVRAEPLSLSILKIEAADLPNVETGFLGMKVRGVGGPGSPIYFKVGDI